MCSRILRVSPCLLLLCLLFFSCATVPIQESQVEKKAVSLVNFLNRNNIKAVNSKVMYPFLLDTEIILQEQDIKAFWQDYIKAGISFDNPEIISIKKTEPADYKEFGSSMDIKVFFKKYLPQTCYLVKIKSKNRLHIFIIKPDSEALPVFYGYKGASL